MMLGGQHDIARTHGLEQRGPFVRLPLLVVEVKGFGKAVVVVTGAILRHMVGIGFRFLQPDRVEIPLRVRVLVEPLVPVHLAQFSRGRRPGRDGIEAPMHKDAELGVGIPVRQRMTPQRRPTGVILRRRPRRAKLSLERQGGRAGNHGLAKLASRKVRHG